MSVTLNQPIAPFSAQATTGEITSEMFKGRYTVLYFYPKDNTSGCTMEGRDFAALYTQFKEAGCEVIGVSRDSIKSHTNFCNKQGFPFALISDSEETLCKAFDVIKLKKLYGREYMGIERSTFLIDPQGVVCAEWRKVKVAGHAQAVLEHLKSLQ
ncbi:peroxiredoxin [Parasutterella secunda]|uniref:peroxiredoxin n=1 Tax=Parasutterella secunda TaxID=626947 RepID=UPI002012FEA1|nr:peroxiredoxin [Parasutterella secunda]MCL1596287.1 peroxiredoxin [Parasutterella secunda]MCR8919608.1 peroxiredoxin [Parasutterella secunda]